MSAHLLAAALAATLQIQALEPIPAQAPIAGWVWSILVPALLFALALGATVGLYRRFSGGEGGRRQPTP